MAEVWKNLLAIVSATQTVAFGGNKLNNNYVNECELDFSINLIDV